MNIFIGIISILLFISGIIIPYLINGYREDKTEKENSWNDNDSKIQYVPLSKAYTIAPVLLSIILLIASNAFVIVPTGYTGVKITLVQISEETIQNGINFKMPCIQSIEKVNNKQQDITFDGQIWAETEARTAICYQNITVTCQINSEKSAWIYANVSNYKNSLISQDIVSSAVKASSKKLSDEKATNRSSVEPSVKENLQKSLDEKYGDTVVIINKVTIENAEFEESYNNAIAEKQKAQLEFEKQAIENKKTIDKAKAESDAIITKAQAEAKANALLEKSLTDKILREKYIEKWNGNLPNTILGDDISAIINP